jgi:hypothetical protein
MSYHVSLDFSDKYSIMSEGGKEGEGGQICLPRPIRQKYSYFFILHSFFNLIYFFTVKQRGTFFLLSCL